MSLSSSTVDSSSILCLCAFIMFHHVISSVSYSSQECPHQVGNNNTMSSLIFVAAGKQKRYRNNENLRIVYFSFLFCFSVIFRWVSFCFFD